MTERWRAVVGWEGCYEVSDRGRVRSLDRRVNTFGGFSKRPATRLHRGKILRPHYLDGYPAVSMEVDGQKKSVCIHTLMLEAFVGARPEGLECCHNDGDKLNCHLPNLRWDTHDANMEDAIRHGRRHQKHHPLPQPPVLATVEPYVVKPEQWRAIIGSEGEYEVSDQGRVRSLDRIIHTSNGHTRMQSGKTLVPTLANGVFRVILCSGGHRHYVGVGRLVLEAFVGPCPRGMECCHGPGGASDSRLETLRWDTRSENALDEVRHGTNPFSRRTHCKNRHEYTPENTSIAADGSRRCLACGRENQRRSRELRRAAA